MGDEMKEVIENGDEWSKWKKNNEYRIHRQERNRMAEMKGESGRRNRNGSERTKK